MKRKKIEESAGIEQKKPLIQEQISDFDEKCKKYRKIFEGWDKLSFAEKRDRINNFRCGYDL